MNVQVLTENMLKGAKIVKQKKRHPLPVLNHVHLYTDEGRLGMATSNGDKVTVHMVPARVDAEFETCAPLGPLTDWLRVTAEYDALLILTFDPRVQILTIQAGNTRAEFKCIDAAEFPAHDLDPAPESLVDKWISKAVGKGERLERFPQLARAYGNLATDGNRVHYDSTLPEAGDRPDYLYLDKLPHYAESSKAPNMAQVNTKALAKAIKTGKAISRETIGILINGRLDVTATDESGNTVTRSIEEGYQHTGPDVSIWINPSFVLDALSGMRREFVTMRITDKTLFITDGERDALIMQMRPPKTETE